MNAQSIKSLVIVCTLACLATVTTMPAAVAAEKRPWQIEDSFRDKRIGDLQLSPDGEQLLFVVSEKDLANNASYSSIWLWSESGGAARMLTDEKGSASSPRWSPSGDRIAFFASDDDGQGLWTMNPDGSDKKKLVSTEQSNAYLQYSGPDNKIDWSPDGKRIAYSAAGPKYYPNDIDPPHLPTGNDVMVIDRLLHKAVYFYSDLRRTHIFTIPAAGGNARQLTSGEYDYHSFSWSPDGRTIACVSNRTGADDFNANNDILFISAESGRAEQMTHTEGPEYQVRWSPDGSALAFEGRTRSGRSKESDAELIKIYVMPASGGDPVNLTASTDRWVNGFEWDPAGRTVWFTAQNEGRVELYAAAADGGRVRQVIAARGQVGDFEVAQDGTVYYVYGDFTHPAEIWRADRDGSGAKQLTSFNQALVDDVNIVDSEYFSFESFDGLRVDGWVMKPVGYREGEKYPTILHIHGGPHGQLGYRLSDRFQEQAANGYATVYFTPRGSTGRGQAFSDMVVGDIAGGDFRDVMLGLDHAIERYDFIDADNLGVTGTSYGGYMTNMAVVKTNRFKAAVPVSGISNLVTQWSEGANPLWYESDMEMTPFEDYEKAWDVSPMKYIGNASTPTLFINGRWDFITTINQADSMFIALKKLGVDTQIALYPNEGHGVGRQPKHTADYHARALAWFDKYLK